MNEFVVYILKSIHHQKTYVGYTANLIQRFYSHNKLAKKGYTTKYRPWQVVYVQFFESKKETIAREKFLKSGKGRAWIKQYIL